MILGPLKVYIGYEEAEHMAYEVAVSSLLKRASIPVSVTPLHAGALSASGLLYRTEDRRGSRRYDLVSNAPFSTDFHVSRFLVPILAQSGWSLFVDSDVVFLGDVAELLWQADPGKAVMVVKHNHQPTAQWKMVDQEQTKYSRKNWSSVCLWQCDHPANKRLSVRDVNERPGRDLHNFYFLHDSEIGELPAEWNWLVNESPKPAEPRLAHFTAGGPFREGWKPAEHDDIWLAER